MHRSSILLACLLALGLPDRSGAQTIGMFRCQLQPYCDVLTLTITQVGATYRLETRTRSTQDEWAALRETVAALQAQVAALTPVGGRR